MQPIKKVTGITVTFEKDTPSVIADQLINDVAKVSELYRYSKVNLKISNTCPECGSILKEWPDIEQGTLYRWKCLKKGCNYKY